MKEQVLEKNYPELCTVEIHVQKLSAPNVECSYLGHTSVVSSPEFWDFIANARLDFMEQRLKYLNEASLK